MAKSLVKRLRYIAERYGPYILAVAITLIAIWKKINYIDTDNMDNALGGVLTAVSLIVGFIAAILPVILGMKNDSKVVVYVFQRDSDKLFLKYIKSAIMTGLVTIVISIMIYFRESYINTVVYRYIFYAWIFFLLLFLGCTYRAVSRMLQLIFTNDDELPVFTKKEETAEMKTYKNKR